MKDSGAALECEPAIRHLLDYLDARPCGEDRLPTEPELWSGWWIQRVGGGRNNLLYRATGHAGDLAVKFTVDDGRDRAGHEYGALRALCGAGLDVAPSPVLLDRTTYHQPVVVQCWLTGAAGLVPTADDEWEGVVRHLMEVHRVTPETADEPLPPCAIDVRTARQGQEVVRRQLALLPQRAQPSSLRALVHRLAAIEFAEWVTSPVTLCRLDNNIANYIRRSARRRSVYASVDWEYSGWGDPAFDVANLVTHVALMDVPAGRWDWFVDRYCALVEDETAPLRIQAYRQIMLVWWPVRLARYLHEIPAGTDQRLAAWPSGWRADIEAKYEHYLAQAVA